MTLREAAAYFRSAARKLEPEVRAAERMSILDVLGEARARSSGRLRAADLRRMDHPYARRHGAPRLNPDIVNAPTGEFLAGWTATGPETVDGGLAASVYNADPKAGYLEQVDPPPSNTPMFARHPEDAAAAAVEPRRAARLEDATRRAFE